MTHLNRSLLSLFAVACLLAPLMRSAQAETKERPNILFVFADDLAFDCLGYAGNPVVKTPNIDRLAKRSVSFTQAYNMGAWGGAVCVASRAMLNSGQFVWQAHELDKKRKLTQFASDKKMWSQQFEKAGYSTYMAGKWHVQVEAGKCFQKTGVVRGGMPSQTKSGYNRPKNKNDYESGWKPWETERGGYWKGGKHWSEVTAEDGIAFLEQQKGSEKPFFLYLAFNAAHDPRQAPKEFIDMYPPEKVDLPSGFLPEYPYKDFIGCGPRLRDERLAPFPRTEYSVKINRGEYYALITHMDQQIGRVLKALEESGRAENTLLVFTADHGLACGHHGFLGKQNMYEHSVRVPFLISGPGIGPAKKLDMPVYFQDVVPTTLESAKIEIPSWVQFKSLHPLVQGKKKKQYPAIYGCYMDFQRMIRKDNWKLITYPKANVSRLYHLETDPQELKDLAKAPEHALRLAQLKEELEKLQKSMADPLQPTKSP